MTTGDQELRGQNLGMGVDLNQSMQERSGNVKSDDPLVSLLYTLLRDHITPGEMEKYVREVEINPETEFTNGWLALYAVDLANRIRRAKEIHTDAQIAALPSGVYRAFGDYYLIIDELYYRLIEDESDIDGDDNIRDRPIPVHWAHGRPKLQGPFIGAVRVDDPKVEMLMVRKMLPSDTLRAIRGDSPPRTVDTLGPPKGGLVKNKYG